MTKLIGGSIAIAVGCGLLALAQAPPDKPDLKYSALDKKSLEIAKRLFKDIAQYGHLELIDETIGESYIQHNPIMANGREGLRKDFGNRQAEDIKPEWKNPPTLLIASGPYVIQMRDTPTDDPNNPGQKYVREHFDLVRIGDGKIQEHWDEGQMNPPAAGSGGAQAGNGGGR